MAVLLPLGAVVDARAPLRPRDYHAVVVNGPVMGSAFLVADTLAVTNAHVLHGLGRGREVVVVAANGARARGRVVAVSRRMDLGVLRTPAGFLPVVSQTDARRGAGTRVAAAGVDANPGPRRGERMELAGTLTGAPRQIAPFGQGIIARMPGVRPGFSGGPVLDQAGRLVGMVAAIRLGPGAGTRSAGSSFSPVRESDLASAEAFVLDAAAIRTEVRRLLEAFLASGRAGWSGPAGLRDRQWVQAHLEGPSRAAEPRPGLARPTTSPPPDAAGSFAPRSSMGYVF